LMRPSNALLLEIQLQIVLPRSQALCASNPRTAT
jgi:hypothetical protein